MVWCQQIIDVQNTNIFYWEAQGVLFKDTQICMQNIIFSLKESATNVLNRGRVPLKKLKYLLFKKYYSYEMEGGVNIFHIFHNIIYPPCFHHVAQIPTSTL